jgi:tRNA A-37 threonylcarbamoyl transferase component Bud32
MLGNFSEEAQKLWDFTRCERKDGSHYGTAGQCRKGVEVAKDDYGNWETLKEGNYGRVSISPDGTRVVKTLLERNGKKGEFGPHEVELATRMGELGHSPTIHSHSANHIEMDVAPGEPLWAGYAKGEDEPVMNATQARKAADAIKTLHREGFFHGDMHSQQFLVNGDDVKLVDYGLSGRHKDNPRKVIQDLNKIGKLINWENPSLANDPYFELVNRYRGQYAAAKGNKNKENTIADSYLRELQSL